MTKLITFSTYQSLQSVFKEVCTLHEKTMSKQLEEITENYLNQTISLSELEQSLNNYKEKQDSKEAKKHKLSIMMDEDLYAKLKERLSDTNTKIRPASFFCFAMAYSLHNISTREIFARKAEKILEESGPSIRHVIFGLKYYKPITGKKDVTGTILIGEEYFIDICTEQRFKDYYDYATPFLEVLGKHR